MSSQELETMMEREIEDAQRQAKAAATKLHQVTVEAERAHVSSHPSVFFIPLHFLSGCVIIVAIEKFQYCLFLLNRIMLSGVVSNLSCWACLLTSFFWTFSIRTFCQN